MNREVLKMWKVFLLRYFCQATFSAPDNKTTVDYDWVLSTECYSLSLCDLYANYFVLAYTFNIISDRYRFQTKMYQALNPGIRESLSEFFDCVELGH